MRDFHVRQFPATGKTACDSKNCACASCAMAVSFGTRGKRERTAHDVRTQSHTSCIPGVDTPSGGITIGDVERVGTINGVDIDYGRAASSFYRRWTATEIKARLGSYYGAILQGMYVNVKAPWRAHGSTFTGGHSVWSHDYREDFPDSHDGKVQATVCWHDPLRPRPIRVPWSVVVAYTQTASPLKGFAGWVRIPLPDIKGATYAKPMTDRTRTAYPTLGVHDKRTKGPASTIRVIRGEGKLVEVAMYATGESYRGSTKWGALSLLGDEWIHLKRVKSVGGST